MASRVASREASRAAVAAIHRHCIWLCPRLSPTRGPLKPRNSHIPFFRYDPLGMQSLVPLELTRALHPPFPASLTAPLQMVYLVVQGCTQGAPPGLLRRTLTGGADWRELSRCLLSLAALAPDAGDTHRVTRMGVPWSQASGLVQEVGCEGGTPWVRALHLRLHKVP